MWRVHWTNVQLGKSQNKGNLMSVSESAHFLYVLHYRSNNDPSLLLSLASLRKQIINYMKDVNMQ